VKELAFFLNCEPEHRRQDRHELYLLMLPSDGLTIRKIEKETRENGCSVFIDTIPLEIIRDAVVDNI
jgi:hypothetical protein